MKSRLIAVLVLIAAALVGGLGYLAGHSLQPAETAEAVPPNATLLGPQVIRMAEFSDDQRAEMEGIIRNYLIANPEIIRDAINELQRKEDQAEKVAQSKTIEDSRDLIFSSNRQVVLGNPNGSVTLVEFFDYNCTYCRRAQADMKKLLASDPDLKVVLKEFPVLGDGSVEAARVAIAVQMTAPEKYAAFHDELLGEPGQVNGERALAVAADLGLDVDAIKAKIGSEEVKATINEVYDLAGKLNLTGTPSYVTHKEVVVGAVGYDALKAKLEEARAACGTATC